jgi:hypothetical protein
MDKERPDDHAHPLFLGSSSLSTTPPPPFFRLVDGLVWRHFLWRSCVAGFLTPSPKREASLRPPIVLLVHQARGGGCTFLGLPAPCFACCCCLLRLLRGDSFPSSSGPLAPTASKLARSAFTPRREPCVPSFQQAGLLARRPPASARRPPADRFQGSCNISWPFSLIVPGFPIPLLGFCGGGGVRPAASDLHRFDLPAQAARSAPQTSCRGRAGPLTARPWNVK